MGILDEALRFRQYQDEQDSAAFDAVPSMMQSFISGQQTRRENMLAQFKVDAELATKGLKRDPATGSILRDSNLGSSLDSLKAQDYQSKIGYRNMLGRLMEGVQDGGETEGAQGDGAGFGTYLKGFGINGPQVGVDTPKDQATRASGLRKELVNSPLIKSYRDLDKYSRRLDAALNSEDVSQAISDQALIILFNKMLDENSVVREGEYARTGPEALSWENRVQGWLGKLQKGGAGITKEERRSMVELSKRLLDSSADVYNQELDRYSILSDQYGVKRDMVLGGLSKAEKKAGGKASNVFSSKADVEKAVEAGTLKVGDTVKVNGQTFKIEPA